MKRRIATLALLLAGTAGTLVYASSAAAVERRPINVIKPDIIGTAQIGKTLSATRGTWFYVGTRGFGPRTTYSYQWLREGDPIPGATASTYELTTSFGIPPGEVGSRISVRVTAHAHGFSPVSATSTETAPVQKGLFTPGQPTITGINRVGETLTVHSGTWDPQPFNFTYIWYVNHVQVERDFCNIIESDGCIFPLTYKPKPSDVGKRIRVVLTPFFWDYKPVTRTAYAGFTMPSTGPTLGTG